jgi:hypothetical protein
MNNNEIIKFVNECENSLGMSDFQSRYFVVNSQVTNYRRVRQAMIEIDTRIGMKKQIERNRQKRIIERQMILRDIEKESDELKKQLLEIDVQQADWDIHMYDKKERMCQNEMDNFLNMIKDAVPDMESLNKYKDHNEAEEKNYWVTRMAKQAAMDINTIGRISQGNMDSILMMPLEDATETITLAIKYNHTLARGIDAIGQQAVSQLEMSSTGLSYIDQFAIEQLKLESKTKSEDI